MTESQGANANAGAPSYADLRRQREEEPKGGKFLRAKDHPNGLDVTVTGTEVIQNATTSQFRPGQYESYWNVTSKNGPSGLIRETKPMKDKLSDLDIDDPTGKSFMLLTVKINDKPTWAIARAL